MNVEELEIKYNQYGFRDKICVPCDVEGCERNSWTNKDSAIRNIRKNGFFRCRICSYSEESKRKIAKASSYKRSPETCQKMAEAKKAFYRTEEGHQLKKKLSIMTEKTSISA